MRKKTKKTEVRPLNVSEMRLTKKGNRLLIETNFNLPQLRKRINHLLLDMAFELLKDDDHRGVILTDFDGPSPSLPIFKPRVEDAELLREIKKKLDEWTVLAEEYGRVSL